nr:hypothetical protein [Actinomycetota bacterium]
MNPLRRLHTEQQSPWLDDLTREQLANGELHRLIDRGIRGLTFNPSTFQPQYLRPGGRRMGWSLVLAITLPARRTAA